MFLSSLGHHVVDSNCSSSMYLVRRYRRYHITFCKQFAATSYSMCRGCGLFTHMSSHNLWLVTSVIIDPTAGGTDPLNVTHPYILTHIIIMNWLLFQTAATKHHRFLTTRICSLKSLPPVHIPSPLIVECRVSLFVSTLGNEWAGKCCHIVPIQAQWRVCCSPLEWQMSW